MRSILRQLCACLRDYLRTRGPLSNRIECHSGGNVRAVSFTRGGVILWVGKGLLSHVLVVAWKLMPIFGEGEIH